MHWVEWTAGSSACERAALTVVPRAVLRGGYWAAYLAVLMAERTGASSDALTADWRADPLAWKMAARKVERRADRTVLLLAAQTAGRKAASLVCLRAAWKAASWAGRRAGHSADQKA